MGRALGVDLGSRRIGFALSDPDRIIASNYKMVECRDDKEIHSAIADAVREGQADLVVIGHPLNMDGSHGPAAQRSEKFQKELQEKLEIPVELWDERLTTKSAHDVLIAAGTRREKRRLLVDKISAQIMLQSFLDAHSI
ncbi:MAG TPA: Holliday junction resolvase RuvX [Kiritimatiellia bacterium]|nr:Holliday junction resolvase RuvX [Kiritimatiellia bacterium]